MSISILEYHPGEPLQPFVELFWEGRFNISQHGILKQRVVPNGFVELIIHFSDLHCDLKRKRAWSQSPDYTIIGLHSKPYEVQFSDLVHAFGIRFKPEGIYNLFGIPASLFREGYDDMKLILGPTFHYFCEELRDACNGRKRLDLAKQYLITQLQKNNPELTYVNRAAELIRNTNEFDKIEELPNIVYVSLRQLEREFKEKIGTTPKRYMRINRLNEVYKMLENQKKLNYSKVAYECGYSDQSHFIRDFKSIMGVKPTIFVKNRHQFLVSGTT
ncbi:MAG: helix-turn-helix domain-containing protein [Balneolaceae bacterium]|nr:helix-turn-helix domain-containing protein [Balneolaceae bacterium]